MPDQPNILVFLTDDHGQWASHCYGNTEIHSPTMDYLAATGARMTRAFTPCPVCSPARASFFTGRLPSQHGIHDWIHEPIDVGRAHPGLKGQTNIGELLQSAGYQTALIGKWHCGHSWDPQPGFDRWFSYGDFQFPHKGRIKFSDQGGIIDFDGYQTPVFTDHAIDFLRRRNRSKPFFLFVGYVDTHAPYRDRPERLVERYRACHFRDIPKETFAPCHGRDSFAWRFDSEDAEREALAQYYAAVSFIDEQMGRILDELDNSGALEETLVVYTSDHGHMNGHHGLNTKGNATTPQNFLDESILVPCLLSWNEHIPSRRVIGAPVDHTDLFCTLLEIAGAEVPKDINTPGKSYLRLLTGEGDQQWKDAYIGEYGNARCIRSESLKLIRRYPGPNGTYPDEFYDLAEDPRERENRIGDPRYADAIAELSKPMEAHFDRYEIRERSGKDIASQPRTSNNAEPWHREV
ncbi:MAG: hypothetical protein COS85_06250 [Armatimonadetes bacterium CG07_land_8_20_14_0_80_59_28]|nr:MAG: hypothetical protein COS85_06250 [Armatimonadetes bacterium CG07_land_8_20_14_0_80_59_28]PIX38381.1 MAG: hypothetical protein COZ56_20675 [Armatimonadetes bacterium CG_4_8_14_3_um_filter_58_9]PIY44707.1 MAG: hypothetical protein COZ05_07435 [Armatimonadetes bacterium CG_4_10_14_3_um_filter_59_10]